MAKVADVFGRLNAFTISVLLYVLGYIQMATSSNVQTFAAAQIFYSAGGTGIQILIQILIADTSNLLNRALWSSLPDIPFLVTVWIGSIIANDILKTTTWRWGYGMWCIILPALFLPLALTLYSNNRKAKRLSLTSPSQFKGMGIFQVLKTTWFELDLGGIILLGGAFALILIPLTLASKIKGGWGDGRIIAMLVIGFVLLVIFPLWESSKKVAPRPLIPLHLFNRTFCAGCGLGFFYFSKSPTTFLVLSLMHHSGFLPLSPTIFLLLPPRRPKQIHHCSRPHNPNLLLHLNRSLNPHLPSHKIHLPLPTLRGLRISHLSPRDRSHDTLPQHRCLHGATSRNTNGARNRWGYDQRPRPIGSSSFYKPPTCCYRHSSLPYMCRNWGCRRLRDFRRSMGAEYSHQTKRIFTRCAEGECDAYIQWY